MNVSILEKEVSIVLFYNTDYETFCHNCPQGLCTYIRSLSYLPTASVCNY